MKKAVLGLCVLTVLVVASAPVFALSLMQGEQEAKFDDHSNLYYAPEPNGPASVAMLPRPLSGAAPVIGDENRAIFSVTTIQNVDSGIFEFTPVSPTELTGLFYNLNLIAITPLASGALQLDFGQSSRNPLPGTPAGMGGVLEIYEDGSKDYTPDPNGAGRLDLLAPLPAFPPIAIPANGGPRAWVEGQDTASRDSYPFTTDGSLWLSGVFVDYASAGILGHAVGTVMSETIDLSTGIGSGSAYVKVLSSVVPIQGGYYGPNMDLQITYNVATPRFDPITGMLFDVTNYNGVGWWQVDSHDPAGFSVLPEPATMTLLGLGIVGLGARLRRSRK